MEERKYFQIVQQSTEKVSSVWKVYYLITLITAAISGLVTEIYFCRILNGFSNNCILSAKITFRPSMSNSSVISTAGTRWTSDNLCQFCSVMWITSFLLGAVFAVFFFAFSKESKDYEDNPFSRPWRLICPVFFISVVMVVNMAIATGVTVTGLKKFCAEFEPELETKKCTNAIDRFTIGFSNKKYSIGTSINITIKSAFLTLFAWILFTVFTLLRICFAPDFTLLLITVKTVKQKKYANV